MQQTIEDLK